MGWLYKRSIAPHRTPKDYLNAQFTRPDREDGFAVLNSAMPVTEEYYAAVQLFENGKPTDIIGIVCFVEYNPFAKDGYVFGYKQVDETANPYAYNCPPAILDLLTPTTDLGASDWRTRCRTNASLTPAVTA
jgi:hypothetical protein